MAEDCTVPQLTENQRRQPAQLPSARPRHGGARGARNREALARLEKGISARRAPAGLLQTRAALEKAEAALGTAADEAR